ncbi:glycine-rich RNA-binding protein blt801-like [Anopheles stephensi]|uniref:glycine-rich RNA-binding protein blt801-like n=1 Tax=Anopheles stephensi TaxID=30069 RepID=UPI0007D12512|nr:glycine-rich RNA-binding protein blt801-like [Anopheles stephensi]
MGKLTVASFLLTVVLLVHYVAAEQKKPDEKLARVDGVDELAMIQPLEAVLGELEGLRIRRAAQGGGGQGGGQGGPGKGGRRGPPDGNPGQGGGQSGGQASGEN